MTNHHQTGSEDVKPIRAWVPNDFFYMKDPSRARPYKTWEGDIEVLITPVSQIPTPSNPVIVTDNSRAITGRTELYWSQRVADLQEENSRMREALQNIIEKFHLSKWSGEIVEEACFIANEALTNSTKQGDENE